MDNVSIILTFMIYDNPDLEHPRVLPGALLLSSSSYSSSIPPSRNLLALQSKLAVVVLNSIYLSVHVQRDRNGTPSLSSADHDDDDLTLWENKRLI